MLQALRQLMKTYRSKRLRREQERFLHDLVQRFLDCGIRISSIEKCLYGVMNDTTQYEI